MKPIISPSTFANMISRAWTKLMSHTRSVPVIAVPARLPRAPMPKARSIETTPISTAPIALAPITLPRWGIRVNVVSPVRWLHSPVTARMATIGRMTAIGKPIEAANES